MATPSPKRTARTPNTGQTRNDRSNRALPDVVDPLWLLKALGVTVLAAALCAYLALCLLVHQGGWQLMLHPQARLSRLPSVPYQAVRFDAAASGTPRLSAWWVPGSTGEAAAPTLLLLHGGDGNLSQSAAQIDQLHRLNVNIFAIDYGGYGQSDQPHPTEARMTADAEAALEYLTATRHIPMAHIVPFGTGLGAALAAVLAAAHADLPAVILQNADPDAPERVSRNSKSRLLPMRMLVHESFDVRANLAAARQPRLLLLGSTPAPTSEELTTGPAFLQQAASPKMTVTLPAAIELGPASANQTEVQYEQAIRRFLDEYLPAAKL